MGPVPNRVLPQGPAAKRCRMGPMGEMPSHLAQAQTARTAACRFHRRREACRPARRGRGPSWWRGLDVGCLEEEGRDTREGGRGRERGGEGGAQSKSRSVRSSWGWSGVLFEQKKEGRRGEEEKKSRCPWRSEWRRGGAVKVPQPLFMSMAEGSTRHALHWHPARAERRDAAQRAVELARCESIGRPLRLAG